MTGPHLNTAQFNGQPTVGTGPWTFTEWVRGSHVTVRANETYWGGPDGAAKGGPHIDQYVYKVVPDQTAILNNLRTAEADFGEIQPKDAEPVRQIPHVELKKWLSLRYSFIGFNLRRPVLQDKAVRKALAMGLDSRTMIDTILFGEGDPLASHMLPGSWAYNPDVPLVQFDPAGARRLLDEAGYRPGPDGIRAKGDQKLKFTLYTNTGNKPREAVATIAQQQWKEIGVDLEIQFEEFTVLLDRMRKTLDFDMIIIGWTLSPEPDPEAIFHSKAIPTPERPGNNFVGYANLEVDRLIEQGKSVPGCSKDERQEIYFELQEILAEDQPYIWLFLNRSLYGFNQRIQGVDPSPFRQATEASWNLERWRLTP